MFGPARIRLILGLAAFGGMVACGGAGEGAPSAGDESMAASQDQEASPYADISVARLREMLAEDDPFLVNVHIPFEGDIPGTDESIPFDEIAQHLDQLPQDKDANIVLYCRSGRMSEEASSVLASLGFTHVSNLEGGFRAWEAAGYDVLRDPGSD